jgi:hypothetical protein
VVKKSSKFWQVIVNYGRFVSFKEQLGFFEFHYELALANHRKKSAPMCGKTQNFPARRGRSSHDPNIFFVLKSLRRVQIC